MDILYSQWNLCTCSAQHHQLLQSCGTGIGITQLLCIFQDKTLATLASFQIVQHADYVLPSPPTSCSSLSWISLFYYNRFVGSPELRWKSHFMSLVDIKYKIVLFENSIVENLSCVGLLVANGLEVPKFFNAKKL